MQASFFLKLKPYRFRLLAGVLFCILLVSTWFLFSQKPDYPEEVHISLQEQLKHIIQDALYNQEEGIYDLQFQEMQTSVMARSHRIKAEFQYSFMDKNEVKVTVVGVAHIRRRHPDSETKHDIWLMDHFETKPPVLEFSQPILLLSGKKEKMNDDENLYVEDNSDLGNDEDKSDDDLSEQPKEEELQQVEQEAPSPDTEDTLPSNENVEEQTDSVSEREESVPEAVQPAQPESPSELEESVPEAVQPAQPESPSELEESVPEAVQPAQPESPSESEVQ